METRRREAVSVSGLLILAATSSLTFLLMSPGATAWPRNAAAVFFYSRSDPNKSPPTATGSAGRGGEATGDDGAPRWQQTGGVTANPDSGELVALPQCPCQPSEGHVPPVGGKPPLVSSLVLSVDWGGAGAPSFDNF